VIVGRHTPGLRAPIFFLSGASGVGFWKFLCCDAVSAAVTVPVVVALGYYFGEHLDEVRSRMHQVQYFAAAGALLLLGGYLYVRRRRRRLKADAASASGHPSERAIDKTI
jgi:LPXTG-motif cell wall-anchored protein